MITISTPDGEVELIGAEADAFVADLPGDVDLPYRIGKSTPWRRMTDTEATDVAGAIKQQSIKNQMIYDAASYIDSGDPLFSMLRQLLVAVVGEARADELLAPEVADVDQP